MKDIDWAKFPVLGVYMDPRTKKREIRDGKHVLVPYLVTKGPDGNSVWTQDGEPELDPFYYQGEKE